jgi:putative aminopeptidase FrvX
MSLLPDSLSLLASLVSLPGPPGQEGAVRSFVSEQLTTLGCRHETDAKGNLLAALPGFRSPESHGSS